MQLTPLTAISPIDGRYFHKTVELRPIFSEYGLFRFRVLVEIHWLKALADEPQIKEIEPFSNETQQVFDKLIENFGYDDAQRIKDLEATTNHDIKAIEYFLKKRIKTNSKLKNSTEFIHFACTSEDINNLAYALMLKEARENCLLPAIQQLIEKLKNLAKAHASHAMLARTHGQAAVPTTVGKELANFAYRLMRQKEQFAHLKILGKLNGAVGNYNAHCIAYPNIKWHEVSKKFVEGLGLAWNPYSTQIEPHDYIAEYCDTLKRINTILINLSADMWGYISLGYFKQKLKDQETGSSTMPHKINPIDFENAEGNLSLANSLYEHFSRTLPNSRWQRDLRDSTLLRNLGVVLAHSLIGYKNLLIGLEKINLDEVKLAEDLNQHWEILAEAIQTILRRYAAEMPYEKLKILTRGKKLDKETLHQFIDTLELPEEAKQQLLKLTPADYLGYAEKLAKEI